MVGDLILSGANPGLGGFKAWAEIVGSGVLVPATIVAGPNGSYLIDADLDFGSVPSGVTPVLVGVSDSKNPANSQNSWTITDEVVVFKSEQPPTITITD